MSKWLLFVYKVPREPTAGRVYVWRKMKQLGALALQDAIWVLPATARTQEQFQWIAAEIVELGGDATLWKSDVVGGADDAGLVARFTKQADKEYAEILAGLRRKGPDLKAISERYRSVAARDYFESDQGRKVREKLLDVRGGRRP
jgi:hypothetical protein